jgi:4-aminobutyrate aminotransferase-like enzyme
MTMRAVEHYGVLADILVTAKGIAGERLLSTLNTWEEVTEGRRADELY